MDGFLRSAFDEDCVENDITMLACIGSDWAEGTIMAKQAGCVAGLPWIPKIFSLGQNEIRCELLVEDGAMRKKGMALARIEGPASVLLSRERVALNLLQNLSGIATLTAKCVKKVEGKCQILDTRKTAPGLRMLQKYAVKVGGGTNHRLHLGDRILIKNNHLAIVKSLKECIVTTCIPHMDNVKEPVDDLHSLIEAKFLHDDVLGPLIQHENPETENQKDPILLFHTHPNG